MTLGLAGLGGFKVGMKSRFPILGLFLLAQQGHGQIIRGTAEIKLDQGLRFEGQPFKLASQSLSGHFEVGKDTVNADLFLKTTGCPLCLGCCCLWELGSSRPFHLSKVGYDSTDFSTVLNLSDASRFERVDTTREGSQTFLPHTRTIPADGRFLVFRNSRARFILARITAITEFIPNYALPTKTCSDGLKLEWMMQGNGQPYFPASTGFSGEGRKAASGWPGTGRYFRRFLIDGRRIPCAPTAIPKAGTARG